MSSTEFMELFKVNACNFTSYFTGNGWASITNEIFYIKDSDWLFMIIFIENKFPVVGKLER
jgi:hypothetical protein